MSKEIKFSVQPDVLDFCPLYKENQLLYGRPDSPVGIVSLWTERQRLARELGDEGLYAAIGQLYSAERGLDPLVRNLLYNPQVRYLLVCGRDLSGSGKVLEDFFAHGVKEHTLAHGTRCWRVKSLRGEGYIDLEVPLAALEDVRRYVQLVVCRDVAELKARLSEVAVGPGPGPYGERRMFPKQEPEVAVFPAEETGFRVEAGYVAHAWLKILRLILRFGTVTGTHYDLRQREVLDLVSVIRAEDPQEPYLPEYLPCDKEQLVRYFPQVLTGKRFADCSYTYGQRLRCYFAGVDQLAVMAEKILQEPETRSAVAVLWDPVRDNQVRSGAPCLNHLWARLRGGRLYLTAVIRSNDMFSGWPENAFALRKLQEELRQRVVSGVKEVTLGDLVIISQSAHIYEDCWEAAKDIVAKYYHREIKAERYDPRGNFIIEVKEGRIMVEHISPRGERLAIYEGSTASQLRTRLMQDMAVFSPEHAAYLGGELAKAELAAKFPDLFSYVQDRSLKVKKEAGKRRE